LKAMNYKFTLPGASVEPVKNMDILAKKAADDHVRRLPKIGRAFFLAPDFIFR